MKLPIIISLLACLSTSGFAATIYQSGEFAADVLPYDGLKSDSKPASATNGSSPAQTAASLFVLDTADSIQAISFEGFYYPYGVPPSKDVFQIAFFENGNGIPGEQIGEILGASSLTRTYTGLSTSEGAIFHFELDLSTAVDLEPGTYWIALIDTSTYEDASFFWSYNDRSDVAAYTEGGITDTYHPTNFRLVYTLENTKFVPEPSVLILGALGAILTTGVRKRRSV
ncbi:hypothetical protein JIN85_00010 [Luteolibacter pohnpeiensis]|uniref:PEP-CTERM protein-sorting domain-containing protein n=1 Tax=Luteolibacter pohnpeiensis TaxID=454153 RepID=A0A934S1T5_9BACT|nr:hypothetical protein [Luteolibacter pohnpeiensis]MBK1880772.1 hypothetical protein [Luteolibacter pohnpeiensis]